MAGRIRQPIDEAAFSNFIEKNVPEIKLPIDVKQVCRSRSARKARRATATDASLSSSKLGKE